MRRRIVLGAAIGLTALTALLGITRMHRTSPSLPQTLPSADVVPQPPAAAAATQAFRDEQDTLMRSELSPLARIDYVHLTVGEHPLTGDGGAILSLPAEALLPYAGKVRIAVRPPSGLTLFADPPVKLDGALVGQATLTKGQVIALGLIRLLVSGGDSDRALAVYDLGSPARRAYTGLHYFPSDDRYRVRARLTRYAQPRSVRLSASRGEDKEMSALGLLHFTLPGDVAESMEAYLEQPGGSRLFLIFRDGLSGKPGGSYGAGRFLYATLDRDDTVWLDFNQAWNPLCAYSAYFHCPLPPRQNWLRSPLPVGERVYAEH